MKSNRRSIRALSRGLLPTILVVFGILLLGACGSDDPTAAPTATQPSVSTEQPTPTPATSDPAPQPTPTAAQGATEQPTPTPVTSAPAPEPTPTSSSEPEADLTSIWAGKTVTISVGYAPGGGGGRAGQTPGRTPAQIPAWKSTGCGRKQTRRRDGAQRQGHATTTDGRHLHRPVRPRLDGGRGHGPGGRLVRLG